jgi:hypothetical protein
VNASHDALVELFERIESVFKRLGVYTQISLTTEMAEVFVKIVVEVLSILSIATKEMTRNRTSKLYMRNMPPTWPYPYLIRYIFQEIIGQGRYRECHTEAR